MNEIESRHAASKSPFAERNFRFQWSADLATSLAFEMETLILGWFVLTTTESVIWLTVFGSLQFSGTLLAPLLGVVGDRVGQRRLLAWMRLSYLLVASCVAGLAAAGALGPLAALGAAAIVGLVRPSDSGVRSTLTASILPPHLLHAGLGTNRVNMDTARIVGALAGASSMVTLGIERAYVLVIALYLCAALLTFAIREPAYAAAASTPRSFWRELAEGLALARGSPALLAALCLAWLTNFAAFPLSTGLLPHVARNVYGLDQAGLALLSASFAAGALGGSLTISLRRATQRPGQLMMGAAAAWFTFLIGFALSTSAPIGMALLFLAGAAQSYCIVPMSVLLLRSTLASFRGRVMGLRMLSVYGLPFGLLLAGFGIADFGFATIAAIYGSFGLAMTVLIAWHWRAALVQGDEAKPT